MKIVRTNNFINNITTNILNVQKWRHLKSLHVAMRLLSYELLNKYRLFMKI